MATSVETEHNRIDHDPDGMQVSFYYDFQVNVLSDMYVYADGLLYPGNFVMTGLGDPLGGAVVFDDPPLAAIETLTLLRRLPLTQEAIYPEYGPFPAKTHEGALDKLTWICQQLAEELTRAVKFPVDGVIPEDIFPDPDPGKTLVWNANGTGFDNAPAEGSFLDWVERAETAAEDSEFNFTYSYLWAMEEEGVLVDDGIHPPGYSAYHWAQQSEEGGILDVTSTDPAMLVINTPIPRYREIEPITGTAGGMVKLDSQGLVPLENLPFAGSLRFIHMLEGHNRCPKWDYDIPDEEPCVAPDRRNPGQRVPSIEFKGGDYFVIVQCDDEPALNQMNLIDPETEEYVITDVVNGDAVIYLAGGPGEATVGWYHFPGFARDTVLASDVIFDDTNTEIKGDSVQEWNQAADSVIDDKVDQIGDLMTGNLDFMNNIGIRGYGNDATTLIELIKMGTGALEIGGGSNQPANQNTVIRKAGQNAITISGAPGTGSIEFDRIVEFEHDLILENNEYLLGKNAAGTQNFQLIGVQANNSILIGGSSGSTVLHIMTGGQSAMEFGGVTNHSYNHIEIPNSLLYAAQASNGQSRTIGQMGTNNDVNLASELNQYTTIDSGTGVALQKNGDNIMIGNEDGIQVWHAVSNFIEYMGDGSGSRAIPFDQFSHISVGVTGSTNLSFLDPLNGTQLYIRLENNSLSTVTWPSGVVWGDAEPPPATPPAAFMIVTGIFDGGLYWMTWTSYSLAIGQMPVPPVTPHGSLIPPPGTPDYGEYTLPCNEPIEP